MVLTDNSSPPAGEVVPPRLQPLILVAMFAALPGCDGPPGRTAEVHGPDGGRFYVMCVHRPTEPQDPEKG